MTSLTIKRVSRTKKTGLVDILIYALLILWALGTIYPFVWVINASFKTTAEILTDSFTPSTRLMMDNYQNAFGKMNILRAYGNSLLISGSNTVLVLLFGTLAAFGLTRYTFRGQKALYSLVVGSLMFPAFSTIIPVFRMIFTLDLINKPMGVILPQVAGNLSFAIIVLYGFLSSMPVDLEEAAFLDGCGVFQIFFRIVTPLVRPALATVAIFSFLWSYNDLFTQIIIMRDVKNYPICALLNEISSKYGTDYGLMASSVVLIVIPVLIVYIFLQKNIIKGLTVGALKG